MTLWFGSKLFFGLLCWVPVVKGKVGSIRIPLQFNRVPFVRSGQERRDLPISGSDQRFGEYSVDVIIGGQPFSLLLDTGSSDLAIGAVDCHGCTVKINRPYSHVDGSPIGCDWCDAHKGNTTNTACKAISSSKGKICTFITSYADKSGFSAALYNDSFAFADGLNAIAGLSTYAIVGAMYNANFPNPKMVDGIIGIGGKQDTTTGAPTPIDALVAEGKMENIFSICLHPNGNGGHFYLGRDGPSGLTASATPMPTVIQGMQISDTQWTPMLANTGFYGVGLQDVRIDGKSLGVAPNVYNDGMAIVDSGTQDVTLPHTAMNAIKAHFAELCTKKTVCLKGVCDCSTHRPLKNPIFGNRCVHMTPDERSAYPMIEFEMTGGVVVQYPPSNYLKNGAQFCSDSSSESYTIAVSSGPDGDGTILGESFMQGYLVVHDRQNLRMGFEPVSNSNCPGAGASSVIV